MTPETGRLWAKGGACPASARARPQGCNPVADDFRDSLAGYLQRHWYRWSLVSSKQPGFQVNHASLCELLVDCDSAFCQGYCPRRLAVSPEGDGVRQGQHGGPSGEERPKTSEGVLNEYPHEEAEDTGGLGQALRLSAQLAWGWAQGGLCS